MLNDKHIEYNCHMHRPILRPLQIVVFENAEGVAEEVRAAVKEIVSARNNRA